MNTFPPTTLTLTSSFDSYNDEAKTRYLGAVISNRNSNITVMVSVGIDFDEDCRYKAIRMTAEIYDVNSKKDRDSLLEDNKHTLDYLEEHSYTATPAAVYERYIPRSDAVAIRGLVKTDTRIAKFCNPQPTISLQALRRWMDSIGIQEEGDHQDFRNKVFHALTGVDKFATVEQPQYAQWGAWQ